MIKIDLDGTEFEFRSYDGAIEFLMACRHKEENGNTHIHDFTYASFENRNFCYCGEYEVRK